MSDLQIFCLNRLIQLQDASAEACFRAILRNKLQRALAYMSPSREHIYHTIHPLQTAKLVLLSKKAESIAIHSPLSIVAELFASSSGSSEAFFSNVTEHFSTVLADHVQFVRLKQLTVLSNCASYTDRPSVILSNLFETQIPRLENVNQRGTLVRFRCMVQDTGLANEVYAIDVGGEDGRGCCAFSEGAASGSPIIGVSEHS